MNSALSVVNGMSSGHLRGGTLTHPRCSARKPKKLNKTSRVLLFLSIVLEVLVDQNEGSHSFVPLPRCGETALGRADAPRSLVAGLSPHGVV